SRLAGEVALVLAPGGEFAFVMIGAAIAGGVVPAAAGGEVMIIVTLSMFVLPVLGRLGAKLGPRQAPDEAALAALAPEADVGGGRDRRAGPRRPAGPYHRRARPRRASRHGSLQPRRHRRDPRDDRSEFAIIGSGAG